MICIDANFGLVRRLAAGVESCLPHHQELFFTKQSDVDKFVNSSDIHTNEVISVSSNAKVVLVFVFA